MLQHLCVTPSEELPRWLDLGITVLAVIVTAGYSVRGPGEMGDSEGKMKCRTCGKDAYPNRRICYDCMQIWRSKRKSSFEQATDEIGPVTKDTLEAIQKRIKELEKG